METTKQKLVRMAGVLSLDATIIATLILPIVATLIARDIFGELPQYVWIVLLAFQFVFGWFSIKGKDYLKTLLELSEKRTPSYEEQQKELSRIAAQSVVIHYTLNFVELTVEQKQKQKAEKLPELIKLLEPIDVNRVSGFGFDDPEALYSFALFLEHPTTKELFIKARIHDTRLVPRNRKRAKGDGHAGISFEQNKIWISPDATTEELLITKQSGNGEQEIAISESDRSKYTSFISIPFHAGDTNRPIGVLTITNLSFG
jgi:hypothetical protein